jgi:hypothetical protein
MPLSGARRLLPPVLGFLMALPFPSVSDSSSEKRAVSAPPSHSAVELYLETEVTGEAGAGEDVWSAVAPKIAREEYRVSSSEQGLQAPNRAHNVRTYFHEGGIMVVPRDGGAGDAWRFAWETTRFGRSGTHRRVEVVRPETSGPRVTYRRAGFLEWYENSPVGIEQGFTIYAPPPGEGPLYIAGRLGGSLQAKLRAHGEIVDLLDAYGTQVLRYGELHVWDAEGKELPSRLALECAELAILIEDEGAAYPLTVDPLMTAAAWMAEGNQLEANFGSSVGTAGDVNGDGYSDVIVAASAYDNGQTNEGRVFVYHGSDTGLATTAAWTAEGNQANAFFGSSAATGGDVNGDGYSDVIVASSAYDNGQTNEGRSFVYYGSPAGLATTAGWTAESNQANASFGSSVSSAGDVNGDGYSDVIVGADEYDNGQINEGRVYVYHGSAAGLATTAAWTGESDEANSQLGNSVATAGDVNGDGYSDVVAGAWTYTGGQSQEGRAVVYLGSASGLEPSAAWMTESDQANAWYGSSVASAGDVNADGYSDVIVGAQPYSNGETQEGRAYVYHGSATGLSAVADWTAESDQQGGYFGFSVATAGDVDDDGFSDVVIAALYYDNGEIDEGRAYVYHGSVTGLASTAGWTGEGDQTSASFGISAATAGDVNADGYSDVIVGAIAFDNGQSDEGRAFVYHGSVPVGVFEPPMNAGFELSEVGPNPTPGRCEVLLGLGRPARLAADVIDASGRRVAVIVDEAPYGRGSHRLVWDGQDEASSHAASGVYFLRVRADGETQLRKVVLLR